MTDLLQRLDRAVPLVEQWMDRLHVQYRPSAVLVGDIGFTQLPRYVPPATLNSTWVASVDRVPFPPVSAYGLPEFESLAATQMAGVTFGDMYFIGSAESSESLHFHELVHVIQWNTHGVREFLLTYALGIAERGYRESPLESIAYDLQTRFELGNLDSSIIERVANHAVAARDEASRIFRKFGLGWDRDGRGITSTRSSVPDTTSPADPYELSRFVRAQETNYDRALAEIRSGQKRSHWMWFIFPQYNSLGLSATSRQYAIKSKAEAEAYLHHPVLGPRLLECAKAALNAGTPSATNMFGSPDDMKLRSCATLFARVSGPASVFEQLLDKFFSGKPDGRTIHLLSEDEP